MDRSADKEVASLSSLFGEWDKTIWAYDELIYGHGDVDVSDQDVTVVTEVHKILESILRACTRYGHFRDKWDFSEKIGFLYFGQDTSVESVKIGARFTIGIYQREIFLGSTMIAGANIRKMGDDFWAYFVRLNSLGALRYQENAVPSSEEARRILRDLRNTKSCIFQFIRNYVLLEGFDGDSGGLGSLDIIWPLSNSWAEIVASAAKAFRCLYKMNYMLHRSGHERWPIDSLGLEGLAGSRGK